MVTTVPDICPLTFSFQPLYTKRCPRNVAAICH